MGTKIKKKCEPFQANSTLSTGNSRIRFAFLLSSHFFRNFAPVFSNDTNLLLNDRKIN